MASSVTASPQNAHRGKRFVLNVFWNWLGVGVGLVTGLLLSPYMIKKIGPEGYGIWALSFAVAEYYWFLDLGFRSATVKFVAHYWAREEFDKVSEVVNTGITYAGVTSAVIFVAVAIGGRYLDRFFQISASYRASFFTLVMLVTIELVYRRGFQLVRRLPGGIAALRLLQPDSGHDGGRADLRTADIAVPGLRPGSDWNCSGFVASARIHAALLLLPQSVSGVSDFLPGRESADAQANGRLRGSQFPGKYLNAGAKPGAADSDRALSTGAVRRLLCRSRCAC